MLLLFFLPVEIWREHILRCLTLVDIVRADSAFLNRKVAFQFLALINGVTLVPSVVVEVGQAKKLQWCLKRNILPNALSVCGELDAQTSSAFPKLLARVTQLYISESAQNLLTSHCSRLVQLDFYNCLFVSLGNLSVCPNLTTLFLYGCSRLTSESLRSSLVGCNKLENCTIDGCDMIDEHAVSYLLFQGSDLISLQFNGCSERPYNLLSIVENCARASSRLRTLVIICCIVCSRSVRKLAELFPQLQKLHLDDSTSHLVDADVEFLSHHLTELKDVAFYRANELTSAALACIARSSPSVTHLNVSFCSNVGDAGVIAVAKGCARLESLNLTRCADITDEAVREVWLRCERLQNLTLRECVNITDAAFAQRVHPVVRELDVSETSLTCAFLKQAPALVHLSCNSCHHINSDFVHDCSDCLNSLVSLCLNETQLSVGDLLTLSLQIPRVRILRLSHSKANDVVVRSVVTNCPDLKFFSLLRCTAVTDATVDEMNRLYKQKGIGMQHI